jgi:hypothetical protein
VERLFKYLLTGLMGIVAFSQFIQVRIEDLDAAASLIFERPKRTRHQVNWPEGLIERIKADCARSPTLARFADETV